MVFCRERERERPPLSLILPHLFLGAERDVTQDSLSARGISYVLSVSRCSPQPSFLPVSQYLRIPIDDSLRDDLLPWIPAALRFIDGAMSSGGAVLVHCAAGISRSPALAVAYIMYSMGLDLDHAYRFVKERRPSISPNFNFLGQLQHFQGSLRQKSTDGNLVIQPLNPPNANHSVPPTAPLPPPGPGLDYQGNLLPAGDTGASARGDPPTDRTEETAQRCSRWGEAPKDPSEAAACALSRKLQTLDLTLNLTPSALTPSEPSGPAPCRKPTPPPAHLHLPIGHASLLEKRRSLTLSLFSTVNAPHAVTTPTPSRPHPATAQTQAHTASVPASQTARVGSAEQYPDPPAEVAVESAAPEAGSQRQRGSASSSCTRSTRPAQAAPQGPAPLGGRAQGKSAGVCPPNQAQSPSQKTANRKETRRGEAARRQLRLPIIPILTPTLTSSTTTTTTIVDQQPSAENKKGSSTLGLEENAVEDQSPLSPLNLTLNKLLGWGERMLLGVLLGPQIKMGQAALPYRC
ncbi:dual specificity protein phosphatase 8 [Gadus macrocephalus]|uniref:dual specificity protein phosphatase 8 n=1 Tax=Gadus macrocephalus TaxID=80720 RepID=UPI0028CB7B14|nr:dual specificity protein phosphatase 8 [Gadus macrocephalus]